MPGNYLAMCMIGDPSSNKPHAMLGMLQEFHVA
jgi:hypothetical protein